MDSWKIFNFKVSSNQSFININNKENETPFLDKEFLRFINEIKLSIKNVGNSTSIYKSYSKVQHLLDLKTLSKIYRLYSQETNESNKVGLSTIDGCCSNGSFAITTV